MFEPKKSNSEAIQIFRQETMSPLKSKAFRLLFREAIKRPELCSKGANAKTRAGIPTWSATLEVKMP